jgi:pimeloyl-ACP methyl ester carboxylesterase
MRFVFVHGGFHAAWCWARMIDELERLGHDGIAVDLPGHGARVDEESTLANRRDAIVSELKPGDVLVGHLIPPSRRQSPQNLGVSGAFASARAPGAPTPHQ